MTAVFSEELLCCYKLTGLDLEGCIGLANHMGYLGVKKPGINVDKGVDVGE